VRLFRAQWTISSLLKNPFLLQLYFTKLVSSVPTLCEQNQLVVGNRLNFVAHRLCK
jgi:hypothetical protein